MTGGIGFSRQGKASFEENHKLAKIRTLAKDSSNTNKGIGTNPEAIENSIEFAISRKIASNKFRLKIYLLIFILLASILGLVYFFGV